MTQIMHRKCFVPESDTKTSISLIMSSCSIGLLENCLIVWTRVTSGTWLSSATRWFKII